MNPLDPPEQRPETGQLSAWLDGELDPAQRAGVEDWLNSHPEDLALTRLWAADRDALRARFDAVQDEPVPPPLLQALLAVPAAPAAAPTALALAARPAWRQAALVAGLLVCGGLIGGWLGAAAVLRDPSAFASLPLPWRAAAPLTSATPATATNPADSPTPAWPHRAAVAHAVYAPEVRHPVEVNVAQGSAAEQRAQEEHLARWLSKRLGLPVRLHDLRPLGFELVGGRLLPDLVGPSAQLMYQNAGGQRVTLYLRKPEAGTAVAFKFQREGELNLFYWVEDGFGCALVGKLPREQLLALAEAVYRQVEPAITPTPDTPRPAS